jgi:hypothetical protein
MVEFLRLRYILVQFCKIKGNDLYAKTIYLQYLFNSITNFLKARNT